MIRSNICLLTAGILSFSAFTPVKDSSRLSIISTQSAEAVPYRAKRRAIQQLSKDKTTPRHIKGWLLKQEPNRLEAKARLQKAGSNLYSEVRKKYSKVKRNPPGYDWGHRIPGDHSSIRLEHSSTNRARPGIAKRVGNRLGTDLFNRIR